MVAISSKLDLLCNQKPEIAAGLESLKLSVEALEKNTAIPVMQHVTPVVQPQYTHNQEPVEFCKEECITSEVENQLIQLFESSQSEFTSEGGRSVLYYVGEISVYRIHVVQKGLSNSSSSQHING